MIGKFTTLSGKPSNLFHCGLVSVPMKEDKIWYPETSWIFMYPIDPFWVWFSIHRGLAPPSHWSTQLPNYHSDLVPRDHILCLLDRHWGNKHRIWWTNLCLWSSWSIRWYIWDWLSLW